ncbi:MAG: aminotransferase class V-fold PLP-dependent enzyme, partial [Microbacterium gubbeenense]
REHHLPGTVHVMLPGAAGESVLFLLDQRGISVSTGSACQAGVAEPSHVVMALGYTAHQAREVVRISMGTSTTAADLEALADGLVAAYDRIAAD